MMNAAVLRCDGCGQAASAEHVARRLQRLEWATRYRPIHIGTLLLGAAAPLDDSEFLYTPSGRLDGEAALILAAVGVSTGGKTAADVLAECQRRGFFLAHVLECPLEANAGASDELRLLEEHLPSVLARIRRSLKPKRLVPISGSLAPFLEQLKGGGLDCAIVLDHGKAFALDGQQPEEAMGRLREAVASGMEVRR